MRCVGWIVLYSIAVNGHAKEPAPSHTLDRQVALDRSLHKLVNKFINALSERELKASLLQDSSLDDTTLRKVSHIAKGPPSLLAPSSFIPSFKAKVVSYQAIPCVPLHSYGPHSSPFPRGQKVTHATAEAAEASATAVQGRSNLNAAMTGVGALAGPQVVTNDDIASMGLDTSDEWIKPRTGISRRHVLGSDTGLQTLASEAASQALAGAGVAGDEIDLVIVATSTPDDMFGDASSVANAIGAKNAVAFDLTAACSGFLFALVTGGQFLHNGAYRKAVVVGADALTRWVDWDDRNTCILFGDGAGAVVLEGGKAEASGAGGPGILGFELHSDGSGQGQLCLPYSGVKRPLNDQGGHEVTTGAYSTVTMDGKAVYSWATRAVPRVLKEALDNAGLTVEDVDWLLLHQANIRIMQTVAKRLGVPMEKVLSNLDEHGNTSAGSIPIALNGAVKSGKVKPGDIIACAGFGAGLSWGAAIIRWGGSGASDT